MTREETIDAVERLNILKQFIGYDKESEIVKAIQESLDMAIKALENRSTEPMGCEYWCGYCRRDADDVAEVLDRIRAEIKARICDVVSDYTDGYRTAMQGALAILDRYKAESEVSE